MWLLGFNEMTLVLYILLESSRKVESAIYAYGSGQVKVFNRHSLRHTIISFCYISRVCLIGMQTFCARWRGGWDAGLLSFLWSSTLAPWHPVNALHLHRANWQLQSGSSHCQCHKDRTKSLPAHTHTVWTETAFGAGFMSHWSLVDIYKTQNVTQ